MKIQEEYKQKMTAQLEEWDAQIHLLEAKLANVGAGMRIKRTEELQALREKRRVVSEKMKELGKNSGDAWRNIKETADNLWEDLKTGISKAQSKFK